MTACAGARAWGEIGHAGIGGTDGATDAADAADGAVGVVGGGPFGVRAADGPGGADAAFRGVAIGETGTLARSPRIPR